MARYPNGQPIRLSTSITDPTGAPINATALSLTVKKPDLTTQTYSSPNNDSTGMYHQDIPTTDLTQNGHYLYVWTATGVGAGISRGDFDVFDPFEPAVLSLEDAKDALNVAQSTTTYDSEIQAYLDTIVADLESLVGGPLITRTISNEQVRQSYTNPRLALRYRVAQSIISIVDEWSLAEMDVTLVDINQINNFAYRRGELPFLFRGPWCLVTYTACAGFRAGLDDPTAIVIPAAFNVAARFIIQHLWQTQRGPGMAPVPNMDETFLPGMSYAIPNRALEVLKPYVQEVYV
jgi:hypothetical protein